MWQCVEVWTSWLVTMLGALQLKSSTEHDPLPSWHLRAEQAHGGHHRWRSDPCLRSSVRAFRTCWRPRYQPPLVPHAMSAALISYPPIAMDVAEASHHSGWRHVPVHSSCTRAASSPTGEEQLCRVDNTLYAVLIEVYTVFISPRNVEALAGAAISEGAGRPGHGGSRHLDEVGRRP